jgi:acetyl esterase/lipase
VTKIRHGLLVAAVIALTGCGAVQQSAAPNSPPSASYAGVQFVDDLDFGAPQGVRLDVCLPEAPSARPYPAIISVHGGGWSRGDKAQRPWRDACAWLASEGFVVFQPNYRLAPEHPYPAAVDDLDTAIEWIRDGAQVARFGYDPARLGAFGDSAGGNLVALLGTRGEGDTAEGTRVAAVVELSAPLDLTRAGISRGNLDADFQRVQLDYLGCDSYDDCPVARAASPFYQVDASDPPFFVAHSVDEFIPVEQARQFVGTLEAAGIDATFVPVAGSRHALRLLDAPLRASIGEWLRERLAGS